MATDRVRGIQWPPQIVGGDEVRRRLEREAASPRRAHSYVFSGPRGIGKKDAAIHFARILQCSGKAKPCGRCASCRAHSSPSHPDFILLAPPEGKRNLTIESVRDLIRAFGLTPVLSRGRAAVINEAHMMTDEAANALLKTIEEPPAESAVILVTDRIGDILPTVVSRCRSIRFSPAKISECAAFLETRGHGADSGLLARLAAGSPGRAEEIAASPVFAGREKLARILAGLKPGNFQEGSDAVSEICAADDAKSGLEAKRKAIAEALDFMAFLAWESFRTGIDGALAMGGLGEIAREAASSRSPSAWRRASERLMEAKKHILANVIPGLAVSAALAEIAFLDSGRRAE